MDNRIALMIDAENVSYKYIDHIMKEISKYGKLLIARFYGDIPRLPEIWKNKAQDYAIKPMHQFNVAVGKNAADMEMALDAMQIRFENKADVFFLVSSDSDFTPLAIRLKESGALVVGVGDENKVTNAFKSACSEFKYFQYFDADDEEAKIPNPDEDIRKIIGNIIIENGENDQLLLSRLGDILVNQHSDFDPRKYGASTLTSLVKKLGFETETIKTTTYAKYTNRIDLDELKEFIAKEIGNKKTGHLGKLKNAIDVKYPDFNVKHFGFSKFSLFIKSLGYTIINNTFKTNN